MDRAQTTAWLDQHNIHLVRIDGINHDGMPIGKHLSRDKFLSALDHGSAVSDIAFGFDYAGAPYLAWWDEWRSVGLSDALQVPDPSTLALVANRPGVAMALCSHRLGDGSEHPVCPRSMLQRVTDRLAADGLRAVAAFELEFLAFHESFAEARRNGYRTLTPLGLPVPLSYLSYNAHQQAPFMDEVLRRLDLAGVPWDGWNDEAAPGQIELNFRPADAVTACDHLVRARAIVRETAYDLGYSVTFMAKPSPEYGNGTHVHHSVWSGDENLMAHDASRMHWLAGLMQTLVPGVSIAAPTINSYRRFTAFSAAPTHPRWADNDKTVAVRVLAEGARSSRIEYRVGAGDTNPYYLLALVLASGHYGLKNQLDPPPPSGGVGWALPPGTPRVPDSLSSAVAALRADRLLPELLGDAFCSFWANSREWEWLMFNSTGGDPLADATTDWELNRYFEIVG